jgi:hypothetical protein
MIELEALCKRLEEDAQTLKEEKATLEGMVESHNKLIMEITKKTGLDRMGEDANDGGDAPTPPILAPLLLYLRRSSMKALWKWFMSKKLLRHMKSS